MLQKKTPNLVAKILATKFGFVPDCLCDITVIFLLLGKLAVFMSWCLPIIFGAMVNPSISWMSHWRWHEIIYWHIEDDMRLYIDTCKMDLVGEGLQGFCYFIILSHIAPHNVPNSINHHVDIDWTSIEHFHVRSMSNWYWSDDICYLGLWIWSGGCNTRISV